MKCFNPVKSKYPDPVTGKHYSVPCGKCYYCLLRRRFEWFVRLSLDNVYLRAYFFTLTYDDDHLPLLDGVPVLKPYDIKYCIDEVRRELYNPRFLCVGEYGGKSDRPHYHLHIFIDQDKEKVYNIIKKHWNKGFIKIGNTVSSRIMYALANHVLPKEFKDSYKVPPFTKVSRGFGSVWLSHNPNYKFDTASLSDGRIVPLPRYLRQKLGLPSKSVYDLDVYELWNEFVERCKSHNIHATPEKFDYQKKVFDQYLIKQSKKFSKL